MASLARPARGHSIPDPGRNTGRRSEQHAASNPWSSGDLRGGNRRAAGGHAAGAGPVGPGRRGGCPGGAQRHRRRSRLPRADRCRRLGPAHRQGPERSRDPVGQAAAQPGAAGHDRTVLRERRAGVRRARAGRVLRALSRGALHDLRPHARRRHAHGRRAVQPPHAGTGRRRRRSRACRSPRTARGRTRRWSASPS